MKKVLVILATLVLLVGCQTKGYSQINNGDDVLFKGPDNTYTKQDLYKSLKVSGENAVKNDILNNIAIEYGIDISEAQNEAEKSLQEYIDMGYEQYISYYYGSADSFKLQYVNSFILDKLARIYVEENYDKFVEEDKPIKMQIVSFDSEDSAKKMIEDINNGSTFEMAAANNGYEMEVVENVYLDTDDALPFEVKEYLSSTNTNGISSIITNSVSSQNSEGNIDSTNTYYVLNVIDRDVNNFKEDYITLKIENTSEEDLTLYMFTTHDIKFFDQDIYEIMKAKYEVLE